MATRKTTEDRVAREAAWALVGRRLATMPQGPDGEGIVEGFDTAEFETTTARAGGADITLRRVVLTGPWEVVPK